MLRYSFLRLAVLFLMVGGLTLADSDIKRAPEISKKDVDPCAEAMARVRMRGWTATLDKNCLPVNLQGFLYGGRKGGNRVEEAYSFFESNKDIFRMENPRKELILRGQSGDELGQFIVFDQAVNGVKVQSAYYSVHFKPDGMMWEIVGHINLEARQVNTTPAISEEKAKEIAVSDQSTKGALKPSIAEAELLIGRFDNKMRLVWQLGLTEGVGVGSWYYYIDAHSGKVIQVESAVATDF